MVLISSLDSIKQIKSNYPSCIWYENGRSPSANIGFHFLFGYTACSRSVPNVLLDQSYSKMDADRLDQRLHKNYVHWSLIGFSFCHSVDEVNFCPKTDIYAPTQLYEYQCTQLPEGNPSFKKNKKKTNWKRIMCGVSELDFRSLQTLTYIYKKNKKSSILYWFLMCNSLNGLKVG